MYINLGVAYTKFGLFIKLQNRMKIILYRIQ